MNKTTIRGFSKEEITDLAEAGEKAKRENGNLTDVFEEFGKKHGRAKGSVRNFYYEFVRMCNADPILAQRFFSAPPKVSRAESFDDEQTKSLVKEILTGRMQNKSVRRTIIELSGGDEKLMLRYQNKYRNILKNTPALVAETAEEMGAKIEEKSGAVSIKVPDISLKRLKAGINALVESVAKSVREENRLLKRRAEILEQENAMLKAILKEYNLSKIPAGEEEKKKESGIPFPFGGAFSPGASADTRPM